MDLEKTHKELLDLTIEFDRICRVNGIKYTLHGGTMLGAVREHGFIPWDDDIDTAMTREEFLKLQNVLNENEHYYIYGDIKKQFRRKEDNSLWVDIFVCDSISSSGPAKRIKLGLLTVLDIMNRDRNSIKLSDLKKYSAFKRGLYRIVWNLGKLFTRNFKVRMYKYISEKCFLGNGTSIHRSNDQYKGRIKVYPAEWMKSFKYLPFEDTEFMVMEKYHDMLSMCYGDDYMTPIKDNRNKDVHDIIRVSENGGVKL